MAEFGTLESVLVPFVDLAPSHTAIRDEIVAEIGELVDTGAFTNGPQVQEFETAFAAYCGARHCVGVANGLDALRLALIAAGLEPGDEVIVPANTFVATFEAVSQAGGDTRAGRRRRGRLQPRSEARRACDLAAYPVPAPRRSLRAARRHGGSALDRRAPRARGRRGRVPGARRDTGRRRPGSRTLSRPRSASTRGRTSARSATPARSSRTTHALRRRSARFASTGSPRSTSTVDRLHRRGSTRCRRSCSRASCRSSANGTSSGGRRRRTTPTRSRGSATSASRRWPRGASPCGTCIPFGQRPPTRSAWR